MSTVTAAAESVSSNAVGQILTEMVDITTELHDQKADLVAKGVPFGDVNAIVDAGRRSDHEQLSTLREKGLEASRQQFGPGAISEQEFDTYIDRITELAADLMHVRKMAKGLELNLDAINLLTLTVRENPADQGLSLLNDVVAYGRVYGIPIGNVQVVASNESTKPASVLPDVSKPEVKLSGLARYRDLAIEAAIGMVVTVAALWLLT
ncbi:MAG: hypothetical protein KTR33_06040 [Gammaproteobacteria bacterium]|nr:hypothetical protein [Gammaproteobacteria bacterium]